MTARILDAWMRHPTLRHSNHEMFTADRALARIDELGLDDETRALFRSGNADRIFRL